MVGATHSDSSPTLRIPLRHMSLRAGPLPNSFSLIKGQSILLTLQVNITQFNFCHDKS